MFFGEYEHSVDEKGRLALPARFRPKLADGLVVTRGLDGCLFVYPIADWTRLAERISELPLTQTNARDFQRLMFSGAVDGQLDGQGRVGLPVYLREYGAIEREAVVIGVNTRIEIWSKARWTDQRAKVEQNSEFIAEQLANLNI